MSLAGWPSSGKRSLPCYALTRSPVSLAPRTCEHRGIDAHKKVNGRKQHIALDSGGRIWCAQVTAANRHDGPAGLALIDQMPLARLAMVVADKAYRGCFRQAIEA